MQHLRAIKWLLAIVALLGGFFLFATIYLVASGLDDLFGQADIGLVLDSRVEAAGVPTPRLLARLNRTVELYRAGYFHQIIVSGGTSEGVNEAFVMRDYLIARGIPRANIIVDSHGDSTYESARNAAALIHQREGSTVFVVTQYFHVPRTRLALQRFGVGTVFSAHAHWFEARDLYSAPRELLAYLYYYYRSY